MNIFQNNLCIIPARGGSKRISKKNIKDFLGKPIIAYSIDSALRSRLFEEVMVSTDDVEIADIAREYGAEVPFFRSERNADDFATTIDVLREVLKKYDSLGRKFENICCFYPTAPFVTPEKLVEAHKILKENNFDSVLPVMKFSFPIERSFEIVESQRVKYKFEKFKNYRSQDLAESFHDSGQFYWMKKEVLSRENIVTGNTGAIIISELEAQDIDNETDWKLAELKYELLQSFK